MKQEDAEKCVLSSFAIGIHIKGDGVGGTCSTLRGTMNSWSGRKTLKGRDDMGDIGVEG
jgi:hypothetical protein